LYPSHPIFLSLGVRCGDRDKFSIMPGFGTISYRHKSAKGVKILFVLVFFGVFAIFLYYNSGIINSDVTASSLLNPFGEVSKTALPKIPKIFGYGDIFKKIEKLKLKSFVPLPVESGKTGKENPFYNPEEVFLPPAEPSNQQSGNNSSQNTQQGNNQDSQAQDPDISEGSK